MPKRQLPIFYAELAVFSQADFFITLPECLGSVLCNCEFVAIFAVVKGNLIVLIILRVLLCPNFVVMEFLPIKANYSKLTAYQKGECIYDITFYFTSNYLKRGDRTIDQMVQAARSGKQNIAEGIEAGTTSKETAIKLTNVARASLRELLEDYRDYLRVRNLEIWEKGSQKYVQCRRVCAHHNDSAYYREAIQQRNDTAIANIAITLIMQCDSLLRGLIERLKKDFVENGGIREEMSRARIEHRNKSKK